MKDVLESYCIVGFPHIILVDPEGKIVAKELRGDDLYNTVEKFVNGAPTIIENLEYADIVRGSLEDFLYMYNMQDVDKIYKDKIKFYCPRFVCTAGGDQVSLRTNLVSKEYPIEPLEAVSTIGAGDNFNAGLIYGLLKYDVRYRDLNNLNEEIWDKIIQCGKDFAAEVCRSFSNSVSVEFAKGYR